MSSLFLHTYYNSNSETNKEIDRQVEMNRDFLKNKFNSVLISIPFVVALTFFLQLKMKNRRFYALKANLLMLWRLKNIEIY
jgi:hypothetical protein